MLKEMAASKAAKLIAACVCPVAGTTALTMAVPQVKSAVHRATAPRAKALPRTAAARPVQVATAPVPCYDPTPLAVGSAPLQTAAVDLGGITPLALTPAQVAGGPALVGGSPFTPVVPGIFTPGGPGGGIIPVVPEPTTWVQLVLGFAVVGGAARATARNGRKDEATTDAA